MLINKSSKIFIAGHHGLVGSAILARYKKAGYKNIVVRTRQELDLTEQSKVKSFFKKEKPEFVILAAAKVGGVMANMTYPADFLYQNLMIQSNVIWSSHLFGVKKLLFLGSSCIYPRESPQPIKEVYFLTGKFEPTNEGYAVAKVAGMKLCEKIYQQFDKKFVSIMPTNIYGPGDNFDPTTSHVVPALIRKLCDAKEKGEPQAEIWGTGKPKREFLYVDDLADAVYFLMKKHDETQFINVGTGVDISIKSLAETLKKIVGYKGKLFYNTKKPDGMPKKRLDVSKLKALGWRPKTSLEKGLKKTIDWYLKQKQT